MDAPRKRRGRKAKEGAQLVEHLFGEEVRTTSFGRLIVLIFLLKSSFSFSCIGNHADC